MGLLKLLRTGALLTGVIGLSACLDFYADIACQDEDDCPYGYACNEVCEGPGQPCETDADCDAVEAVKNHRDLFCIKQPIGESFTCALSCTPGSNTVEQGCPPGQQCHAFPDGDGACY